MIYKNQHVLGYSFILEFSVLNRLILMTQRGGRGGVIILEFNCFIDPHWVNYV